MQPNHIHYLSESKTLEVTFDTGETISYPTVYLRGYCPCALCQGHSGGPPKWVPVTHPSQARVEDVTPVGNYAMCIVWGDGHDTGIHTFASLAALAPIVDTIPESQRVVEGP